MTWDDNLSQEQKDIVLDPARIKVVRAGPGTGKTRLFVGALQHALENWPHQKAGIAALSYTNVAQQQIAERARHVPPPHLTTTIDGFILRFIIRPFAHLITNNPRGTRLLPAFIAKQHAENDIQIGTNNAQRSKPLTSYTSPTITTQMTGVTAYKTAPVHDQQRDAVLGRSSVAVSGLLTHSDTHYLVPHPA
jgi:superfamily I DNA/RNA helicase